MREYSDIHDLLHVMQEGINYVESHPRIVDIVGMVNLRLTIPQPGVLSGQVVLIRTGAAIAGFILTELIGAKYVYSSGVWVSESLRRTGVGSLLHAFRLDACRNAGLRGMVAIVNNSNTPQLKIMEKFGWVRSAPGPITSVWSKYFA
jgi:GNAT superfamily N-acetyltransferase